MSNFTDQALCVMVLTFHRRCKHLSCFLIGRGRAGCLKSSSPLVGDMRGVWSDDREKFLCFEEKKLNAAIGCFSYWYIAHRMIFSRMIFLRMIFIRLILPLDGFPSFKMAIYNVTLDSFPLSFYITYDVKLAMNVMNGRQQWLPYTSIWINGYFILQLFCPTPTWAYR